MELLGRQTGQVMEPLVSALLRGGEPCWNPTVTKAGTMLHLFAPVFGVDFRQQIPETHAGSCRYSIQTCSWPRNCLLKLLIQLS